MNDQIVSHKTQRFIFSAQWTFFDIEIEATPAQIIATSQQQVHLANVLAAGLGPVCPRCGHRTWRANVAAYVDGGRLIALHRDCAECLPDDELIEVENGLTGITATGRGRYDWPEAAAAVDGLRRCGRIAAEVGL